MHNNTHTYRLEETRCEVQRHIPKMQDFGDTRCGERCLAKKDKEKTGIINSHQCGGHNVFTHHPKDHNCDLCKRTKGTRVIDRSAQSRKFGDLVTAEHKVLSAGNESRCGHRKASIVQDECTSWIKSFWMKTKEWLVCEDFFLCVKNWEESSRTIQRSS